MRYFRDAGVLYSLRKQATAAVIQQISSVVIKQVPPRPRSIWSVGRVSDGLRTISLANLIVLPRPLDTFVNTVPGPYVPGGKAEAPAFTVSVIVTPLVSVVPEVELAVSQEGVLIE
jgi:hypothetical protein